MSALAPYRDPAAVARLARAIEATVTRPWTLMEVCGGQTHAIARYGLEAMLPPQLQLVHGPGCPVCVTPVEALDAAIAIARRPEVILCTVGDMLRVPGSRGDLRGARAAGADVRVVYAPHDAAAIAAEHPDRQVVLLGVGFETTAPGVALALTSAARQGLNNLSVLAHLVRVPPALRLLAADPEATLDGWLAPGHVCTVMGTAEYEALVVELGRPIVVTGFEPVDLLDGLLRCVRLLEAGRVELDNAYARVVRPEGNPAARALIEAWFRPGDQVWRGLGVVPDGGLILRPEHARWDATRRFPEALATPPAPEPAECHAGEVLRGRLRPERCPAFGVACTPDRPLGAPMVSTEGACAAAYRYRSAP